MFNVPLFGIGSAGLWSLDGAVSLQFPWEYNAPASDAGVGSFRRRADERRLARSIS